MDEIVKREQLRAQETRIIKGVPYTFYMGLIILLFVIITFIAISIIFQYMGNLPQFNDAITQYVDDSEHMTISLALSIMQEQYNSQLSSLSMILTAAITVMSVFGIIMPIFNYIFFQKEQISKINSQIEENKNIALNKIDEALNSMKANIDSETHRLQNLSYQAVEFIEAYSDQEQLAEIKPLSDSKDDKAQSSYLEAKLAMNREDFHAALLHLQNAISCNNTRAEFYSERAKVYSFLNLYEDAILDIDNAIKKRMDCENKKEIAGYYYNKGVIMHREAERKAKENDTVAANELFNKALHEKNLAIANHNKAHYLFSKGLTLAKLNDRACLIEFRNAISKNEGNQASFHKALGDSLFKDDKYDEALSEYLCAIEHNKNDAELYVRCSDCERKLRKYNMALGYELKVFALTNNFDDFKHRTNEVLNNIIGTCPEENMSMRTMLSSYVELLNMTI